MGKNGVALTQSSQRFSIQPNARYTPCMGYVAMCSCIRGKHQRFVIFELCPSFYACYTEMCWIEQGIIKRESWLCKTLMVVCVRECVVKVDKKAFDLLWSQKAIQLSTPQQLKIRYPNWISVSLIWFWEDCYFDWSLSAKWLCCEVFVFAITKSTHF